MEILPFPTDRSARRRAVSVRAWLLSALVLALVACGREEGPGPSPIPTELAIRGDIEVVIVGIPTPVTVEATFPGGGTATVQPDSWSSNNNDVLTVDPSGQGSLRGRANGSAELTVRYRGLTARATVRVVPNYGGRWTGSYRVTSCSRDASFPIATLCSSALNAVGETLSLEIMQTGLMGRGTLTLSFGFGASGGVEGGIEEDGALPLYGEMRVDRYTITVQGWRSTTALIVGENGAPDSERMTASFTLVWRSENSPGVAFMMASAEALMKAPASGSMPPQ